jgi:hypothetical protein
MPQENDVGFSEMFSLINQSVIEGGKDGAAGLVADGIFEAVVTASGAELPAIFKSDIGKIAAPLLLCYLIAFATVIVPQFPKAEVVRMVCIRAARGKATQVMLSGIGPKLKLLSNQIIAIADDVDPAGLKKAKEYASVVDQAKAAQKAAETVTNT